MEFRLKQTSGLSRNIGR